MAIIGRTWASAWKNKYSYFELQPWICYELNWKFKRRVFDLGCVAQNSRIPWTVTDKRVHGFEVQLKRKNGTALWVAMSAEIFPEQDFIEGAMRDITVTKVLTHTEKDILKLLMQGLSNKEIAFKTERSVRTVEDHRAHIMQKLGVDNIVDLTQKALYLTNHHTKEWRFFCTF